MTESTDSRGFILVGQRAVVLVAGEGVEHFRLPLRSALASGGEIAQIVEAMTIDGMASMPDFGGLVRTSDTGYRLVVRGEVTVAIETDEPAASSILTGLGVATWREELVEDAALMRIHHPNGLSIEVVGSGITPAETGKDTEAPLIAAVLAADAPIGRSETAPEPAAGRDDIPVPTPVSAPEPEPEPEPAAGHEDVPVPTPVVEAEPEPSPEHLMRPAHRTNEPDRPVPAHESSGPDDEGPSFDLSHLTGDTRYWGVEAAAVRTPTDASPSTPKVTSPPPAPPAGEPPAGHSDPSGPPSRLIDGVPGSANDHRETALGDHDGRTVGPSDPSLLAARVALRAKGRPEAAASGVASVLCPDQHPNPPTAVRCRVCDATVVDRTIHLLPRPSRGQLSFAHGLNVLLDRTQLIGRQPRPAGGPDDDDVVNLVTLPDPEQELSRLHAEIRLEGWEVFVIDRSSNGTWVEVPGEEQTRLRKGERFLLPLGSWVSLADSATFVFEVGRS